ncbi:PaaI family thioesterase [Pseudonocardia alni]|uniref:PaaI family thioesterase n=1 Tax=Pseudonocardia alni TaxID=33907 RepID=UPI002797F464|nr:PaaI family thioesterase [Pseudonocardia alni]
MTSAAEPTTGPATATRRREHEWTDPMVLAAAASGLDGLEYLRRIVDGRLPGAPIASLVGFRAVFAEHGRVAFAFEPGEHQYNPIGSVHGGVYATLLDSACGCAVHSTLPAGTGYTAEPSQRGATGPWVGALPERSARCAASTQVAERTAPAASGPVA